VDPESLQTAEFTNHTVSINNEDIPLKITLVWTDPANGAGNDNVINHLDLEVTAPDGETMYFGNYFSAFGESQPGSPADSVNNDDTNNVEQVLIKSPQKGLWNVRIIGAAIPVVGAAELGQGYALVVTAGFGTGGRIPIWAVAVILMAVFVLFAMMRKYMGWFKPPSLPETATEPQNAID
jgi:hypothetical protein